MKDIIERKKTSSSIFEDMCDCRYNDTKLKLLFESERWKNYDYIGRIDTISYYFSNLYYYSFSSLMITEFIKELESIYAEIEKRKSYDIVVDDNIHDIVDTDYTNIYVSPKNFGLLKMKLGNVKAVFDFFRTQALIHDYNNVINGVNNVRTNEIRLNMSKSEFCFCRENNPLLLYFSPIEYYARFDSDRRTKDFYDQSSLENCNIAHNFFAREQAIERQDKLKQFSTDFKTEEDAKNYIINMMSAQTTDFSNSDINTITFIGSSRIKSIIHN